MKKYAVAVLTIALTVFAGLWLPAVAEQEGEKQTGQQLFETNCKRCHSIERPKSKRKTREGWETTVMRMKNTNGCPITDEEAELIIDHLAQEYGVD